jgi:hypothetical protein
MANPRNIVAYDGIRNPADTVTYKTDGSTIVYSETAENGSAQVGLAVTLSAADTVGLVGDGEFVLGKLILVEADNKATVQVGGYMTLPAGTAATLTRGKAIVGDLLVAEEGYIREVATGTAAELGVCRGFIQNAADTTAVIVRL